MNRSAYYFSSTFLSAGSVFTCNYILSQSLALSDYGLWVIVTALIPTLLPFVIVGQPSAITAVYFSDEKQHKRTIGKELFVALILIMMCTLAFWVFSASYFVFFSQTKYEPSLSILFVLAVTTEAFRIFSLSFVNCLDNYKLYFRCALVYAISLIILPTVFPSLIGAMLAYVVGGTLSALTASPMIFRTAIPVMNKARFNVIATKLVKLGWLSIPSMIIAALAMYLDRYIVNFKFSDTQLGLYALSSTLAVGVGGVLVNALLKGNTILMLQALQSLDFIKYQQVIRKIVRLFILLAVSASLFSYFFMSIAIKLIYGPSFEPSSSLILPLFLTALMSGLAQFYSSCMIQKKKLKVLLYISLLIVIFNFLISFSLMSMLGIKGIITAGFVSACCNVAITVRYAKRYFEFVEFPARFCILFVVLFFVNLFFFS